MGARATRLTVNNNGALSGLRSSFLSVSSHPISLQQRDFSPSTTAPGTLRAPVGEEGEGTWLVWCCEPWVVGAAMTAHQIVLANNNSA